MPAPPRPIPRRPRGRDAARPRLIRAAALALFPAVSAHAGIVAPESHGLRVLGAPDPPPGLAALRPDPRTPGSVRALGMPGPFSHEPGPGPTPGWTVRSTPDGPGPYAPPSISAPPWHAVDPFAMARATSPETWRQIPNPPDAGPTVTQPRAGHPDLDARFGHALLLARVAPLPSPGPPAAGLVVAAALARRVRATRRPGV